MFLDIRKVYCVADDVGINIIYLFLIYLKKILFLLFLVVF